MRTLRLSLAGTSSLALVAALGGAVVSQEAAVSDPALVTGNESCRTVQMGTKTVSDEDGVIRFRDHLSDCRFESSDPRLQGVFRNAFNEDCHPIPGSDEAACVIWGTSVLQGEAGGWDCSYVGHDNRWHPKAPLVISVCPGTGAYTGLTWVFRHVFNEAPLFADGSDMQGVIYEGPAPAWAALEPPVE